MDRQIVTAMILEEKFLRELRDQYRAEYLHSEFAVHVANWCIEYYDQYSDAPGEAIRTRYERACREGEFNSEILSLIEQFLTKLDNANDAENPRWNIDFLVDETIRYWKKRQIELLGETLRSSLYAGGAEQAEEMIKGWTPVERTRTGGFNPLCDMEKVRASLEENIDPLLTFPGSLGELLNRYMVRDSLIGLLGPEKRGKTYWGTILIQRGCLSRVNVAWFQVGDMSESQTLRRLYSLLTGKHTSVDEYEYNRCTLDCLHCQLGETPNEHCPTNNPQILPDADAVPMPPEDIPEGYKPCTRCKGKGSDYVPAWLYRKVQIKKATMSDCQRAAKLILGRMKGRDFKLSVHPNTSINVRGIRSILENWKDRDGFVPDVVVIDYADILAPENPKSDPRQQENERWAALRQLSQRYHCLVCVPTQANRDSYDLRTITAKNSSEDKRKLSHCVGMLGLHQTKQEKTEQKMRISWVLHRETEFTVFDQVGVTMDLPRGRIATDSWWCKWERDIERTEEDMELTD